MRSPPWRSPSACRCSNSAIANIALPTIAQELSTTPAASIWVVNAYQLAVTVSLLPLASLGDIVGYRRVYSVGLAVFTAASLCCALSHSLPMLVAARVMQGLGGAGIMSVNTALVRFIFPRSMLGRGVGFNAFVVATSSATGPTVAAGHPVGGKLALVVRHQRAARGDRAVVRCSRLAGDAAHRSSVRLAGPG